MRRAIRIFGQAVLAALVVLAAAGPAAAQSSETQQPAKQPPTKPQAPAESDQGKAGWAAEPEAAATLPVEALKLGGALKEHASPELRNWIKKYVNAELRGDAVDPARTALYVQKSFAQSSPATRDALVFLLFFSAYEMEEPLFQGRARTLQEMDKEIQRLQDRRRLWEEAFSHPPPGSNTDIQRRVELSRIYGQLEQLDNQRRVTAHAEEISRHKVDRFLRLLDHGHKFLHDFPPQTIAALQPNPDGPK